jgi:hypothetical protein
MTFADHQEAYSNESLVVVLRIEVAHQPLELVKFNDC